MATAAKESIKFKLPKLETYRDYLPKVENSGESIFIVGPM